MPRTSTLGAPWTAVMIPMRPEEFPMRSLLARPLLDAVALGRR